MVRSSQPHLRGSARQDILCDYSLFHELPQPFRAERFNALSTSSADANLEGPCLTWSITA